MGRPKKEGKDLERHRIQVDFSPATMVRLGKLKGLSESHTTAELIRRALKIYDFFLSNREEGNTVRVFIQRPNEEERELEIML